MDTYTLKVVDVVKETEDTVTLCFKQPGLRKIRYKAGQYLTLIFRINGRRFIRPYSFSSTSGIDETLQVTVKRILNGVVSNHIHDFIKIGDSVEVMSPMGDFIYDNSVHNQSNVYLWGTGSGITPLISLAKQILLEQPSVAVNLIYGNKNFEQIIFLANINSLVDKYVDRFKVWHFHSQLAVSQSPPYLVEGRITKDKVLNIMEGSNVIDTLHYICGPAGLKESVKGALFELKIPEPQVLFEDFELVRDPKDFENVSTQFVTVNFNNISQKLEVVKGKSILEAALDAGIELPYSCQTGNCNTCQGKLLSGVIKMIGLTSVREDLAVGDYLMCCSHPISNDVSIEI
jgi:ring-1,2-phenylacetyl-CoA epoxidase subunit PaaE